MTPYSKKRERKAAFAGSGLARLVVRARPGDPTRGILRAGPLAIPCALGKGGIRALKREGDGATPLAAMRLRNGYFRADRAKPGGTRLPMAAIAARFGWCEVPDDRNYNRPVTKPYAASHESMRREDELYDYCLVLDWNIEPRRRGCGSAIFFHLARLGYTPTLGCVAISRRDMRRLLPLLSTRTVLEVRR